jgi:hypothetical protein
MTNEAANISMIESYLVEKLGSVSECVYAGSLPATLPKTAPKYGYVVADCASAIRDYRGYQQGMVNIYLYAKPTKQGTKNVNALYNLEKLYNEFLNTNEDGTYAVTESYRMTDYDSNYGLYYIISAINLIVK